jgi:glycerate kinase
VCASAGSQALADICDALTFPKNVIKRSMLDWGGEKGCDFDDVVEGDSNIFWTKFDRRSKTRLARMITLTFGAGAAGGFGTVVRE